MKGAIAAGIKVGAYIVTQAVNTEEAVEEASFIVNACKSYSISLPLVIDVETAGGGTGRGDKISVSTRTAVINAYAQTVRSAGYTPMLYASKSWLEGRINTGSVYSYCNIWIARYNDTLGYSSRFNMWQFRSDGSVSGIGGSVDISAWIN
jgi:GH25 family lysozyme M1 (1,4-beta-N-acetylmuramidase)